MLNKIYSNKDLTNKKFVNDMKEKFCDCIIESACFYQEDEPDAEVFPEGITGLTLKNCNLDNVKVPDGVKTINCINRRIKLQNDRNDWIVDEKNNPIEPVNKLLCIKDGKNIDPSKIPAEMIKLDKFGNPIK